MVVQGGDGAAALGMSDHNSVIGIHDGARNVVSASATLALEFFFST